MCLSQDGYWVRPKGAYVTGAGEPAPTRPGDKIKAIVRPPPGSPEWLCTNIHSWENVQFQKDIKNYRCDHPNWIAESTTAALEKASHD